MLFELKYILLNFISIFFFLHTLVAQERSPKLEINPYYRYDTYPRISYRIDQRARIDTLQMQGNSYGVNVNYAIPAFKTYTFKVGLGYYRHSFTEITQTGIIYGRLLDGREIYYPNPTAFFFITDRYWYNTVNVNLSIEKDVVLSKTVNLQVGISTGNYFTFSQYYHMPAFDIDYNTSKVGYFGFSSSVNASILKRFNSVQVGPSLIIPIVDMWKKDALLPESNECSFKWKYFNGVGIGLIVNYALHK